MSVLEVLSNFFTPSRPHSARELEPVTTMDGYHRICKKYAQLPDLNKFSERQRLPEDCRDAVAYLSRTILSGIQAHSNFASLSQELKLQVETEAEIYTNLIFRRTLLLQKQFDSKMSHLELDIYVNITEKGCRNNGYFAQGSLLSLYFTEGEAYKAKLAASYLPQSDKTGSSRLKDSKALHFIPPQSHLAQSLKSSGTLSKVETSSAAAA